MWGGRGGERVGLQIGNPATSWVFLFVVSWPCVTCCHVLVPDFGCSGTAQ